MPASCIELPKLKKIPNLTETGLDCVRDTLGAGGALTWSITAISSLVNAPIEATLPPELICTLGATLVFAGLLAYRLKHNGKEAPGTELPREFILQVLGAGGATFFTIDTVAELSKHTLSEAANMHAYVVTLGVMLAFLGRMVYLNWGDGKAKQTKQKETAIILSDFIPKVLGTGGALAWCCKTLLPVLSQQKNLISPQFNLAITLTGAGLAFLSYGLANLTQSSENVP